MTTVVSLPIPANLHPDRIHQIATTAAAPASLYIAGPGAGFVIVDRTSHIRIQRADVYFGGHAGQMLEIVRRVAREAP